MFPAVLADYHNAALGFQGDAAHGVAASLLALTRLVNDGTAQIPFWRMAVLR
jgi:hypothetical protein